MLSLLITLVSSQITARCKKPVALNGACNDNFQCETGLFCDLAVSQCRVLPTLDQTCGNGVTCGNDLGCLNDLCVPLQGVNGTCLLGERGPALCSPGLGCYAGTCASVTRLDQCTDFLQQCPPGFGCDVSGPVSQCLPVAQLGQTCSGTNCVEGAFCNQRTLRCEARKPERQSCTTPEECAAGLSCLPSGWFVFRRFTCAPTPGREGDVCIEKCLNGLICN
jgi:hypothetical protein